MIDYEALRETQRRMGMQLDEALGRQETLEQHYVQLAAELKCNTQQTAHVAAALDQNNATTERVARDTAQLVEAFRTAGAIYRFGAGLGKVVKEWAWLATLAVGAWGAAKGWWRDLWPRG